MIQERFPSQLMGRQLLPFPGETGVQAPALPARLPPQSPARTAASSPPPTPPAVPQSISRATPSAPPTTGLLQIRFPTIRAFFRRLRSQHRPPGCPAELIRYSTLRRPTAIRARLLPT